MIKEEVIEILERFVIGSKSCSQREIVDTCASAYRMLKEQPSLPSNLDEAANNAYPRQVAYMPKPGSTIDLGVFLRDAFKAGAEWMAGGNKMLKEISSVITSLQQEQPEVDLEKVVEFECIGKKVKMTVKELINYYIDSECVDVADECGF